MIKAEEVACEGLANEQGALGGPLVGAIAADELPRLAEGHPPTPHMVEVIAQDTLPRPPESDAVGEGTDSIGGDEGDDGRLANEHGGLSGPLVGAIAAAELPRPPEAHPPSPHKGGASTPIHSQGHDPQVVGKVKEWLDSFDEFRGWEQFVEVNNMVLGLKKQNQFAEVALALSKDPDYGEWWGQVLEWRQEIIAR